MAQATSYNCLASHFALEPLHLSSLRLNLRLLLLPEARELLLDLRLLLYLLLQLLGALCHRIRVPESDPHTTYRGICTAHRQRAGVQRFSTVPSGPQPRPAGLSKGTADRAAHRSVP